MHCLTSQSDVYLPEMDTKTKITFLGTGTSQGVPIIACGCEVCLSGDQRDKRLRSSVLVQINKLNIVIDTGPDFRQQMLNTGIQNLSAVLFTHEHKDHVAGLDDVRPFNFINRRAVDIYAETRVQESLKREYAYIFSENPYPGIPEINMHLIDERPFFIDGVEIIPIRVMHHLLPVLGFRIGNFAYLTDMKTLPINEEAKLQNLDALVLTSLRKEPHISHMNLDEALELSEKLKPRRTYLTHLSHRFGLHAEEQQKLPENVFIAYDGLMIESFSQFSRR